MIIGCGVDILRIERITALLERFGTKFRNRILSDNEISQIPKCKVEAFYAKRFAAKEAIVKAIGCGIGKYLSFRDIEIMKNPLGKPIVQINNKILSAISIIHNIPIMKSNVVIHISISDERDYAIANAILETI